MSQHQSSYRQIFKATSLFGGVQVINILLAIIRSKLIAILLGPAGMGIAGLLSTATGFIGSLTNFGLGISSVRNIAEAHETGDDDRIGKTVTVLRKLVWITGLAGMLLTIVLAPWLSKLTFGNYDFTIAFILLSVTLLFNQLTVGQDSLLQGMRQLRKLAKVSVAGSALGLIASVPFYYYYHQNGIVPALITTSFVTAAIAWYYARAIGTKKTIISYRDSLREGKGMLQMGFMLSLNGLILTGASYIIRVYISNTGGVDDVGLYSAGFVIINSYVGLVFTAMATDYYPRLSAVANDRSKANTLITHQAEVAVLILSPILCAFITFIKYLIITLYSTKFLPISGMMYWAALGIYLKAASWSIAFIIAAKGDAKVFLYSEFIANIYLLLFNILGYRYWGLTGLGISYLIGYFVYFLQIYFIAGKKYKFRFHSQFWGIFALHFGLGLIAFGLVITKIQLWSICFGILVTAISGFASFKVLDHRMDIKSLVSGFISKANK